MEVRRCCGPTKLLGWMNADDSAHGVLVIFNNSVDIGFKGSPFKHVFERFELPISEYRDENGIKSFAVKADGLPIEKLRRIKSFIEA